MCDFVRNDRGVSICEADEEAEIFYGSYHDNWRGRLWIRSVAAKTKKKEKKNIVCDVGFVWTCRHRLKYIITGAGTLVYCYNKKISTSHLCITNLSNSFHGCQIVIYFMETKWKSELLKTAPRYGNMIVLDSVKMSTLHRKILPLDHKAAVLILSCYTNINNIPRYIYIYICKEYFFFSLP